MKKIGVLAVVFVLLAISLSGCLREDTDNTNFGEWKQQIYMVYQDSSKALLDVYHNNKVVSSIEYVLSAKSNTDITLSFDEINSPYRVTFSISGPSYNSYTADFSDVSDAQVTSDGEFHTVIDKQISINSIIGSASNGDYTLTAVPSGSIVYGSTSAILPASDQGDISIVTSSTTYTLTTSVSPSGGGTISLNPIGGVYQPGQVVYATAIPSSPQYMFIGWSGAASGTTNPVTVYMSGNLNLVATFSGGSGTTEDLMSYTLIDPTNYFTRTTTTLQTVTPIPATETSRLSKQMNNNNFDLTFKITLKSMSEPTTSGQNIQGCVAFTSTPATRTADIGYGAGYPNNNSLIITFKTWRSPNTGTLYRIMELRDNRFSQEMEGIGWKDFMEANYNVEYTIHLYKLSNQMYMDVFTGTTLVWSGGLTAYNDLTYAYFYPFLNQGFGTGLFDFVMKDFSFASH